MTTMMTFGTTLTKAIIEKRKATKMMMRKVVLELVAIKI